ncbi:Mu transposase C-terminal domain-containing protein [Streptomyces sp. NPDC059874]|uniref:Mu transposase C-terminal domain-containing protein n=1 Tax=Streptomyces sp. NPDC059874 TaxID=3346983 RepID=UPI00365A9F02
MGRAEEDKRRAAVARLVQLRADGDLGAAHVRLVADGLGVSTRTVWRWLADAGDEPTERQARPRYILTEADREAYAFYRGNVSAVHRARTAVLDGTGTTAGAPVPGFLTQGWKGARAVDRRTLARAFDAEMTPAEREAWKTGEAGRRAKSVYLRRPEEIRGRVWEMDHKQLPILLSRPKGKPVCPWMTTIVDDGTRALVGWALAVTPHTGTVLTAMRMALLYDPEVSPFGAVPSKVRIDRGLEFAAGPVRDVLAALAVVPHRLPAYQPHRKGKVERVNLTIEQTLISHLPGFTGGPRDAAGRLYGPVDDSPAALRIAEHTGIGPMRIDDFVKRLADWVAWYNTERPHRALHGRTPLAAWEEDEAPLARIPADKLRHLLLASTERIIGKDGIRFQGLDYVAPEIQGRGGQSVEVRYMPHDDRTVEVYLDGRHLCTATPTGQLTAEQTEAFRQQQRDEAERLGRERRRASRRARRELAPMTGTSPATESRLVPAKTGRGASRQALDAALRARSSTSLLGITPITKNEES